MLWILEKLCQRPTDNDIRSWTEKHDISDDEIVVAKVGRRDYGKWSNLITASANRVIKKNPKIKYLIIGATDECMEHVSKMELGHHFVFLRNIPEEGFPSFIIGWT